MTEWTDKPPTEPGWYWWRNSRSPDDIMTVHVKVGEHCVNFEVSAGQWWPERIQEPPHD